MDRLTIRDELARRAIVGTLDGIFLAELLLFGLVTVLFLLYFNRVFGFAVSFLVNAYTWTFYNSTFRVQAIQVSPLGGRIFFKGVCYQGQNETIIAHDGYITWRYWHRRVRRAEAVDERGDKVTKTENEGAALGPSTSAASAGEHGQKQQSSSLPCRIKAKVRGLEWFVYNRSPAYDTILATLLEPEANGSASTVAQDARRAQQATKSSFELQEDEKASSPTESNVRDISNDTSTNPGGDSSSEDGTRPRSPNTNMPLPFFLQSLPISITGSRAAMVMGNKHTRSILVAKIRDFDGRIDARPAGPHDQYRQCFDFDLSQGTVSFKHNQDYTESHVEHGSKLWNDREHADTAEGIKVGIGALWPPLMRAGYTLRQLNPFRRRSRESLAPNANHSGRGAYLGPDIPDHPQARWMGLSRYLADDTDPEITAERWRAIEYARVETIADIQSMSMSFFWDSPGRAGSINLGQGPGARRAVEDHVNGTQAPVYGLDINLGGGTINYGPWADRQRADLQAVFFPATYACAKVARRLLPGAWRISTVFDIRIVLDEAVVLRVHTREETKDWRWKSRLDAKQDASKKKSKKGQPQEQDAEKAASDPEGRPAGWLDVTVAKDSCVVYRMDMLAREDGYRNSLDLDIKLPRISTSVNHDLLCRAHSLSMKCDLSNPRLWKALHEWLFDITTHDLELFLLRDHAFLLQDLVNDWTSGPANDFFEFVPFFYHLKLRMPGTRLYLNVNDSNIINSPSSLDDNAFLVIGAERLDADLGIPLTDYQPLQNRVTFDADASQMWLELSTPLWTTQRSFLDDKKLADLEHLSLRGSYNYCTDTSPALTDTVLLNLEGSSLQLQLFGFLIRYFMNFKENYFGEDLHFQTQEEFQKKLEIANDPRASHQETQRVPRPTNDLDVILVVVAKDLSAAMPSRLYSAAENIKVDTPLASLDLRFTNYYMDMQGDFSPLSISNSSLAKGDAASTREGSSTQLFVDGASVVGHRLFGLPPAEPTYVCNWDFDVGKISGEASIDFLSKLLGSVQSFAYGFPDTENSISRLNPLIIRDVIFLRAKVQPIKLWVHVDHSAFLLSTDEVSVKFNDWAGDRSSERLVLSVPTIVCACVDARSASRSRSQVERDVDTYAFLETSVSVRLVEVKPNFQEERQLQQSHLIVSDSRTNRTPWLIRDGPIYSAELLQESQKIKPPAMPFPPMPEPIRSSDVNQSHSNLSHGFLLDKARNSPPDRVPDQTGKNAGSNSSSPLYPDMPRLPSPSHVLFTSHSRKTSLQQRQLFKASPHSQNAELNLNTSLSSAYATPYFPLSAVEPSSKGVPSLPPWRADSSASSDDSDDEELPEPDKHRKSQILIVSLDKGIRALFTPEAVFHTTSLIYGLQATDANGALDEIQTGAMSKVLARGKPKEASTIEVRCELPNAAIRLQDRQTPVSGDLSGTTWYNVFTQGLIVTLRQKTLGAPTEHGDEFSMHSNLDSFGFNVLSLNNASLEQTVLKLGLGRITCWAAMRQGLSANLHVDDIAIDSLNRDTKLLGAIINHAIHLSQELSKSNNEKQGFQERLRMSLIKQLALISEGIPEAPFMTTTSFTLRTAKFNPRNSDSWKLASRLRWVLYKLSVTERGAVVESLGSSGAANLLDARESTVQALHHWRGWDLTDPGSSLFVNQVFGSPSTAPAPAMDLLSQPLHCTASISHFSLAIDPGPKEDSLTLDLLNCVVSNIGDSSAYDKAHTVDTTVTVALFCKKSDLSVKWEMVELIAGLSKEVEAPDLEQEKTPKAQVAAHNRPTLRQDFHVVVTFEQIGTRLETINLELATRCFGLTGSVLVGASPLTEAVALYSNHVISELSAQQTSVLAYKLQKPSVHLSRQQSTSQAKHSVIKAGGFCENLELHVTQDLLGIIGVLDRVLSDEVHFLRRIRDSRPRSAKKEQPPNNEDKPFELHAVLLLDSYSLSAKVLSTLLYSIEGMYARSSCRSLPGRSQTTTIDFDVDSFAHTFTNYDNDKAYQIASLSLPPVNGQITVSQDSASTNISLALALEQIVLDASALHALFTTYSRREISAFRENVARDVKLLQANFENTSSGHLPGTGEPNSTAPSKLLLYRAQISATGLKIKARTGRASAYSARLTFELGPLDFKLHNADGEKQLAQPEMTANIRTFRITLKRFDGNRSYRCGDFAIGGSFVGSSKMNERRLLTRSYEVVTTELTINIYPETASTIVDIIGYLQQRFKSFNLSEEISTLTLRARRFRSKSRTLPTIVLDNASEEGNDDASAALFSSMYSLEMNQIRVAWHVGSDIALASPTRDVEDLRFSISRIHLSTRKGNSARLIIQDLQLQMAPRSLPPRSRSKNSALLPEVAFNVAYLSTSQDRRLAFQAVGKVLDLRLTTQCAVPAANLQKSIALATRDLRKVVADWNAEFVKDESNRNILGNKTLSSVLVAADFAGAVVHISGKSTSEVTHSSSPKRTRASQDETFAVGTAKGIDLQAPGIALKVEYRRPASEDPSLNTEIRIDASSNVLHPAVVPLFYELSESIKDVMGEHGKGTGVTKPLTPNKQSDSDPLASADPVAILGSTRLNLGLRVCKQQFGLTCQPIARVAANAQFNDIYITINTVQSEEQGQFFALSASILNFQSSLQHVYSREATASFVIERITLSLMNSKHVSNVKGLSAILKISPMLLNVNAKQMHDFFLFKEIWIPGDSSKAPFSPTTPEAPKKATFGVRRYQEVAATGAFPWNASVNIEKMDVQLDLGQSLGKSSFSISRLWVSSRKTSDWEQNLCIGFGRVSVNSTGRLSGFIELQKLHLQTSINWPEAMRDTDRTPLIEASAKIDQLQAKLAFEYQAFLVADISAIEFLMYNVRDSTHASGDRLVCLVEGDSVQAFCTTQTSAQCVSLYHTIQRLIQEKRSAYENSLKDVDKFLHRRPDVQRLAPPILIGPDEAEGEKDDGLIPLQLQTNVVVGLKAVKIGAYPRTFFDAQIFKLEALDASAHFSVAVEDGQVKSGLGLSLGQVRVALSNLTERIERRTFEDLKVDEVVKYSAGSRGGTILKVPRLVAEMQTWQAASSFHIDYIFKSSFEGKIEVGWNYSRISYIRGMWGSHSRALAQRLGKPLPQSAVQITGGLEPTTGADGAPGNKEQEKITAVVNVPLSKYDYTALEPPVIVTPQLRDMGEATPPLEWIGLQRDRLPNLTHQIVIVPLLEVAKEVEDAYSTILGSS